MTTKVMSILLGVMSAVMGVLWAAFAAVAVLAYVLGGSTGTPSFTAWQLLLALCVTGLVPFGLFVAAVVSAIQGLAEQGRRL